MLLRMRRPTKFYKYRSLDGSGAKYVEESVFQHKFFFDSPNNFNDPFDCLPRFSFEGTKLSRIEYLTQWFKHVERVSDKEARLRALEMEITGQKPDLDYLFDMYRAGPVTKLPMYCVSEVCDNILMWSHYASNHTGVCLEFDGTCSVFKDAHQVSYEDERVLVDMGAPVDPIIVANSAVVKSRDWGYEKEWRVIETGKTAGIRDWPETALKAVILGDRITPENRKRVQGWVRGRKPEIALRQATISRSTFKVDITDL